MWRLTAPVPNSIIFNALILHALKTKNIDVSDTDKLIVAKKIKEAYSDIDSIRNQTIYYCDEFSFTNSEDERVVIKLKTRFMEKCFHESEFDALYGKDASAQALDSADVFRDLSFSIKGAPTPKTMLFAKPASTKPLKELVTVTIETVVKSKPINIPPPTLKGAQTPRAAMIFVKEQRVFSPIQEADAITSSLRPTRGSFSSDSFDDSSNNLENNVALDEYDVDGKPTGRDTSTSTISTKTPGPVLNEEQDDVDDVDEVVATYASALQFSLS